MSGWSMEQETIGDVRIKERGRWTQLEGIERGAWCMEDGTYYGSQSTIVDRGTRSMGNGGARKTVHAWSTEYEARKVEHGTRSKEHIYYCYITEYGTWSRSMEHGSWNKKYAAKAAGMEHGRWSTDHEIWNKSMGKESGCEYSSIA